MQTKDTRVMGPTIHMNGSNPQRLAEDLEKVETLLLDTYDALARCGPNGRDYYVQAERGGKPAIDNAIEIHRERLQTVDNLLHEIAAEVEAIHLQSRGY